jgi:protocatechuate 3,4-dioxygenase beta subunit
VTVAAGEPRDAVDLELTSRGAIAGTVVDQDGRAVREAIVAWTSAGVGDSRRASTDELGRFVVDQLRPGSYRPSVRAAEHDRALAFAGARPGVGSAVGPEAGLEVVIDAARPRVDGVVLAVTVERLAIAGRVVDDTGAPVPDARIDAIAAPREGTAVFHTWSRPPVAVSRVDGAFSLDGLAAGSYAVRARSGDDREAIASPVAAGAKDVVLELRAFAALDVQLVGFGATPAVDAENARGDFLKYYGVALGNRARIGGLPPGRYIVTAHTAQELDAAAVVVAAGSVTPVTLTSHGSAHLVASVRNFSTGAPVADMRCLVFPTSEGMLGPEPLWDYDAGPSTGAQGEVAIDPAPAGPSAVYCYNAPAGMSSARAFVSLAAGERGTAQLYTVHLDPPGAGDLGAELDQGFPIVVTSVRDDGPAAAAGMRAGDAIAALDGRPIDQLSKGGVLHWIASHPVGAAIGITVRRGSETRTLRVVVGHSLAPP